MHVLETLLRQIDDEICGAREYGELALKLREDNPPMASMYAEMSKQEYGHFQQLYSQLCSATANVEADDLMSLICWNKDRIVRSAAEAKAVMDMYK